MDIAELSDIQSESGVIGTLIYHPEFVLHTDYLLPGYFYGVENGCSLSHLILSLIFFASSSE